MNRSLTIIPFFAIAAITVVACSSSTDSTATSPTGDAGTTADAGSTTDGGGIAALSFKPSNLDLSGIDLSKVGDFVVDKPNCTIYTSENLVDCGDPNSVAFALVDQPNGGGKIGVYVARTISVQPNSGLLPRGSDAYPLALVALDTFDLQGTIDLSVHGDDTSAGGYVHQDSDNSKGGGPGGGTAGMSETNGGGGGGYCGVGGKGASTLGAPVAGGMSYGNAAIIPLIGGSSGGAGELRNAGSGGGAVQLVAGTKFTLGANGTIAVNGGGGVFGGGATQPGSGGGSGGSILIEAPTASILGTLVANGGAGGAKAEGQDGMIDGTQAVSGPEAGGSKGGAGNASANPNGGDATWFTGDNAPGGGGAGGRIRINTTTGNASLSAKAISPAPSTPCATQGTLTAK